MPGKELHAHVVAARVRMDMKVAWGDVKEQVLVLCCIHGLGSVFLFGERWCKEHGKTTGGVVEWGGPLP